MKMSHKLNRYGNYLRVKTYSGDSTPSSIKEKSLEKGHIVRLNAYSKSKGWFTYGYLFNIRDIRVRREKTMRVLRSLGVSDNDLRRMRL